MRHQMTQFNETIVLPPTRRKAMSRSQLTTSPPRLEGHASFYAPDAEQGVLGAMILDNRCVEQVTDILVAQDFFRPEHRLLFDAVCTLVGSGHPCDLITLADALRQRGLLDEVGGLPAIGAILNDTLSPFNVHSHAEVVRERAILRDLAAVAHEIGRMAYEPRGLTGATLIDQAEQLVLALRGRRETGRSDVQSLQELLPRVEHTIEHLATKGADVAGLSTGLRDLDKLTTGLHAGDLIIVAGRPGLGKTSFAMGLAEHIAIRQRRPALIFSMEMPAEQLALRLLASVARVPLGRLRSGDLRDGDWDRLSQSSWIGDAPMFIDERGARSPLDVRSCARRTKSRHGLGLIVVDYIQLMQVPGNRDNRTNEIAEISRNLKALAKELAVPVIALSQLNRGLESRDDKRPRLSDLRESGGLEQDADIVAFIYRDDAYNPSSAEPGVAEIIVAKHRNGPTGRVKTVFQAEFTRFEDLAHDAGVE